MKREINKVLLFNPPSLSSKDRIDINPYPPLGLAYIASSLRKIDIEVKIVDCYLQGINNKEYYNGGNCRVGLNDLEIYNEIEKYSPDIVGVSHMFSRQIRFVNDIFEITKKISSSILTVVGGPHPSALYSLNDKVDVILRGEGEGAIKDIVRNYAILLDSLNVIYGSIEKDINTISFPDWEVGNLKKYFGSKMSHGYRKKKRFVPIITSRGCPCRCSFCSAHCVWGYKYRKRRVTNIMSELLMLKEKYGVEEVMFEDDNLTFDRSRAKELFSCMASNRDFVWDTPNGIFVWSLDEEMLELMKAAGCYRVNFAIESGSERVLKEIMNKHVDLQYAKKMINYARKIGLDVGIFLVIGMPTETEEERQMSYDFCKDVGIYFPHISIATPYPGSKLYEEVYGESTNPSIEFLESLHIRNKLVKKEVADSLKTAEKKFLIKAMKRDILGVIKNFIKIFFINPLKTARRIFGLFS